MVHAACRMNVFPSRTLMSSHWQNAGEKKTMNRRGKNAMTTKAIAACDRRAWSANEMLCIRWKSCAFSFIYFFALFSCKCATFRYSELLSCTLALSLSASTRWRYMMVFGHILEKMVSLLAANVIEISLWYGKLRLRLLLLLFRHFWLVVAWWD